MWKHPVVDLTCFISIVVPKLNFITVGFNNLIISIVTIRDNGVLYINRDILVDFKHLTLKYRSLMLSMKARKKLILFVRITKSKVEVECVFQ